MLVLTRKKEETLQVGNDITLTILKIKGNSVQIGIEAPRHVRVLRGELATQAAEGAQGNEESAPPKSLAKKSGGSNRLRQMAAKTKRDERVVSEMLQLV